MSSVSFNKFHIVHRIPNRFDKKNFLLNEQFSYLEKTKNPKENTNNNVYKKKILYLVVLFITPIFYTYLKKSYFDF